MLAESGLEKGKGAAFAADIADPRTPAVKQVATIPDTTFFITISAGTW
jgi:hypothetical protein